MRLTPRYGDDPIITLDGSPADILAPVVRQRRRLAAALAELDDAQWSHPSRCAGWSGRDVIIHLDSTNTFWAFSIAAGRRGEPTELLATFDPVASPAQLVADAGDVPSAEVLDRFTTSSETLVDLLCSLDDDGWTSTAEAPPGHMTVAAVAHHALWDSWVHERDVLLPLGIDPPVEPDEVAACLRYAAALSPALALTLGTAVPGVLCIDATDPDVAAVVHVGDRVEVRHGSADGDVRLDGDSVDLLEALSVRSPLDQRIPPAWSWMLDGLTTTFDA